MEIWKDIIGYEGYYSVSNLGRVKSLSRKIFHSSGYFCCVKDKVIKNRNNRGYCSSALSIAKNRKYFLVHRLVAIAFIPNPENKRTVNHINGIKTDNRVENLEWCTQKENNIHAHKTGLIIVKMGSSHLKAKLNEYQVLEIRSIRGMSQIDIAKKYNVKQNTISSILLRKSWKHI